MKIITVKCLKDNFSYIILNEKSNNACVIDPGEAEPIINIIKKNKINLKYILNTHHHDDHIGGNLELKKKFNCKIFGFINDKKNIPGIDISVRDWLHLQEDGVILNHSKMKKFGFEVGELVITIIKDFP